MNESLRPYRPLDNEQLSSNNSTRVLKIAVLVYFPSFDATFQSTISSQVFSHIMVTHPKSWITNMVEKKDETNVIAGYYLIY